MEYFFSVSLDSGIQCSVTIDDDEAERGVIIEQGSELVNVELAVTEIETRVQRTVRLEADHQLLLRSSISLQNLAHV